MPPTPVPSLTETYLTVPEVAAELRVSKSTAWRLVHVREIASLRIGRSIRIPRSALDRYLYPELEVEVPELLPVGMPA